VHILRDCNPGQVGQRLNIAAKSVSGFTTVFKILTRRIDRNIVIQIFIDRDNEMQTVTISQKYQIVIPRKVRQALNLRPGQKMQIVEYEGRLELIPERDIKELRGFINGINPEFKREEDRI
jgi:AbrB family looped-hinge helix DNA binding protein